jgi:hypothetical protein
LDRIEAADIPIAFPDGAPESVKAAITARREALKG